MSCDIIHNSFINNYNLEIIVLKHIYRNDVYIHLHHLLLHQENHNQILNYLLYSRHMDLVLMVNHIDKQILFEKEDIQSEVFKIKVISDITDDKNGSVPLNLRDQTIENPVYGVDRKTYLKTEPYLPNSIDVIAVGNLPNDLPRDASRYFGEQIIKFVLKDLIENSSDILERATIVKTGKLTSAFEYLKDYAEGN